MIHFSGISREINVMQFKCCGVKPCNFFCCNCDGKCKESCAVWAYDGGMKKRSIIKGKAYIECVNPKLTYPDNQAQFRFISIDSNGDGLITKEEGRDFMLNGTTSERVKRAIGTAWSVIQYLFEQKNTFQVRRNRH